jgi:hypothetical protein
MKVQVVCVRRNTDNKNNARLRPIEQWDMQHIQSTWTYTRWNNRGGCRESPISYGDRSKRMGHAARMGDIRNSYNILVGKPEMKITV